MGYTVLIVNSEMTFREIQPVLHSTLQNTIGKIDKVIAEEDAEGRLLQPGTVESYNNIAIQKATSQIKHFVEVEIRLVNNIYDSLASNVDNYLDWYYSLAADYARIGKALMGAEELENYMAEKFQEFLYSPRTETYIEELSNLEKTLTDTISLPSYTEFIKDKTINPKPWNLIEKIPAPPIVTYPEVLNQINITDRMFKTRMVTATGAGIAGVIGAKVLSKKIAGKVAAKGVFKMGAKVLAKVAVKTTAGVGSGAAGGAAMGGAIGSVIPVLGTGVGALIGGTIIGVLTWFATDKIFLTAEELLDRDAYRRELLSAINEEKNLQINQLQTFLKQIESNLNKLN